MNDYHTPVLLQEIIEFLDIKKGKKYIDATLGGGGHTFEVLKRGGRVLGIDVDQEAIDYVQENLKSQIPNLKIGEDLVLAKGNFRNIGEIARSNGFTEVSGILFDLGVSSHQLESGERGFSFQKDGPLDMRMDKELGVTGATLINILTKGELYELYHRLGEERYAYALAEATIFARKIKPIETTMQLVGIVEKVMGSRKIPARLATRSVAGRHPATKIFQALRIAVNDELTSIEEALPQALELLENKGRIAVISFHSLEDRIAKQAMKEFQKQGKGIMITKKPVIPSDEEIEQNSRSRSAKLRVFEKV